VLGRSGIALFLPAGPGSAVPAGSVEGRLLFVKRGWAVNAGDGHRLARARPIGETSAFRRTGGKAVSIFNKPRRFPPRQEPRPQEPEQCKFPSNPPATSNVA
jgi:hypothetical protein